MRGMGCHFQLNQAGTLRKRHSSHSKKKAIMFEAVTSNMWSSEGAPWLFLCERDMTFVGGKLEHCRVLALRKGTKRLFPRKSNAPLLLVFRLNLHATATSQLYFIPSQLPS